jgi:hypothetical protein
VYCAVAPELAPIVEWIAARPLAAPFGVADVPRGEAVSPEDVEELFETLREAGVLAPVSSS